MTNNLALLAEVRGEQLSFKIKKETLTAYTVNGSDELMTAYPDVAEREIEYVDDISSFVFDPDKPDQDTTYNVFANSITAFIGVMWRIF